MTNRLSRFENRIPQAGKQFALPLQRERGEHRTSAVLSSDQEASEV